MKTNLRLLGSVVLLTSVGLTACDSATATNEKSATEVKTAVVTEVEKVAEAAPVEVKEQVQKAVEAVPEPAAVKEMAVAKAEEVVEVAKAEVEAPVAEAAKAAMEAPAVEVAKAEVEAPVAEAAKAVMEAPAVEAVKAEVAAPAVEVAKAEVEAPIAEAAKAVMEAPAAETVKAEVAAPAVEVAKTEVEAPVAEATTMVKPAAAPLAVADKEPEFKEGTHYVEIFPTMQTDAVGGKVEVVELMWLACPHCFALEPTIKEYKKNLPDYIDFKQVPAMLNPRWSADAKTFYIAELLDPKGEKKLVDKLFNAIHVQKRKRMASPAVVKSFIMQQGVSEAEYDNAANSMVITAKLNRARQVSADSQAQSVPSIIINGKYRTSPYMAGNEKKLMQVIDMLTKREFEKK